MRICLVSREYPPETHWGGIGTFTFNLAHGLSNIGHDVDVICLTFGAERVVEDAGVTVRRIRAPEIPFTSRTWWDLAGRMLAPFAVLYSRKLMHKIEALNRSEPYDIIDFPEHIGEGFCTGIFRPWPAVVRLYTPLSLIGELGLNRSTNVLDYGILRLLEKTSINKATAVTSPSRNLASLVAEKFKYKRPISIIYNPINTEVFSPGVKSSKCDSWVNILFAGRLEDRKGVHVLAQAIPQVVARVPSVRFVLLGRDCPGVEGHASMRTYIEQTLEQGNCADHVEFRAPVTHADLPDQYRDADIMVVPSLYDNSPYTCLEALACGVPVVGTSAGGMPEYIQDGVCGTIVPPGDADALADALIALAEDEPKRQTFSAAARQHVLENFKQEIIAAEMVKLYRQAVADTRN